MKVKRVENSDSEFIVECDTAEEVWEVALSPKLTFEDREYVVIHAEEGPGTDGDYSVFVSVKV